MTSNPITELYSLPLFFKCPSNHQTQWILTLKLLFFPIFIVVTLSQEIIFVSGSFDRKKQTHLNYHQKNCGYFLEHISRVQMKLKSYQDPKHH